MDGEKSLEREAERKKPGDGERGGSVGVGGSELELGRLSNEWGFENSWPWNELDRRRKSRGGSEEEVGRFERELEGEKVEGVTGGCGRCLRRARPPGLQAP